ncbi:MAG: SMC-Scp complex subunit ScpB [Acidimicrobiia bacterium]
MTDLERTIEAILFVSDAPVQIAELAEVTERSRDDVNTALQSISSHLEADHGIELKEAGGGWRLYTKPEMLDYVERFASTERVRKLSNAAMETLSVIAYKQPVSRGQVTEIRGVDSDHAIRTLERRDLVREVGRAPGPGQAVLYGTTELFLEKMGIATVTDLPELADHVPPAQVMETLEMPMRPEQTSTESTS